MQKVQLDLFKTSNELNLSPAYEAIPKSVKKNDRTIVWINENIAKPLEKTFLVNKEIFTSEITPATIKNKKGEFQSIFPGFRENKIEYVLISLVIKKSTNLLNKKGAFILKTSYYEIQKELVDAINKQNKLHNAGKEEIKPANSPYNVSEIKEALEVLKITSIRVNNKNGKKQYLFNRIKDIYLEDKKVVIELGSMIVNYINTGDWKSIDKSSTLASKRGYEFKLRLLLCMNFRYAIAGRIYNPSLTFLIEKLEIDKNMNKRTALHTISRVLNKMNEVENVEVEKTYNGKKLEDAIFKIHPSKEFVSLVIHNNRLTKRAQEEEYIMGNNEDVIVSPLRFEYGTELDYQQAKQEYSNKKIEKVKAKMLSKFS